MTPPTGTAPAPLSRDLPDIAATEKLGAAIADMLRTGDVVALYGELGAGKTTLARALISKLGHRGEVPSPTFTLVQSYDLSTVPVWHFDLYRIDDPDEIIELGLDEALAEGISLIEWPERMGAQLPANRLEIHLSYADNDDDGRRAELLAYGDWGHRLAEASHAL
ncbi:MAG: tRNA (adenosine(37)-N6)-threonylcarbamoyltransferase complex ATPase subunit type 1 TsaE [Alphaproteobacteria bacterium]|nr:tRNA (adenosine(37)-N6)-threonylcarbamoyltransferase complex ATPase subunit type 1 TsaE [Alphaproteobacteria bacterium]